MKKAYLIGLAVIGLFAVQAQAASKGSLGGRQFESYEDTGGSRHATLTVSSTTISTVTFQTSAKGFKLYPRTNPIVFAVGIYNPSGGNNEDVVISTGVTLAAGSWTVASNFAVGGIAKPDLWEIRLLPGDEQRTRRMYLKAPAGSADVTVDMESF